MKSWRSVAEVGSCTWRDVTKEVEHSDSLAVRLESQLTVIFKSKKKKKNISDVVNMSKSLSGEKLQIHVDVYFSVHYIVQAFLLEELVFLSVSFQRKRRIFCFRRPREPLRGNRPLFSAAAPRDGFLSGRPEWDTSEIWWSVWTSGAPPQAPSTMAPYFFLKLLV